MSSKIYHILLLHAHLPYINHNAQDYIEENWYFENITESYIPILNMIERLSFDGINPNLTISLSPTLCAMMEDEETEKKLRRYINLKLSLIEKEYGIVNDEREKRMLDFYHNHYIECVNFINKYSGDLITPFKLYQNQKMIEVITTPATYPIIPLLLNRESIDAQITTASYDYSDRFSKPLNGMFLSECAYDERIDNYLKKNSIKYFFLDDNAIDTNRYDIHRLYNLENGIAFFIRDYDVAKGIMDENGYLSNPLYREFYRDIGYERDINYLKDFTLSNERIPTGIKYHRITDIKKSLPEKELYEMDAAIKQSESDASDFLLKMTEKFKDYSSIPVVVSCFNMELFGHRWFEGVHFLENIIRKVRSDRFPVQFITPSEYLNINEPRSKIKPFISSWSENGYFDKWLNENNDFIYPYLYEITKRYIMIVNKFVNNDISIEIDKSLKQLTREILLMQSSDWATLINYNTHKDYAVFRFKSHYENANSIINSLNSGKIDMELIKKLEKENSIFPFINWRVFSTRSKF